ncbi:MAG: DUF2083 domain-containing protein [Alphaproteobacteria bacterium]|nr:DUF2083 domain-containing protein [Alphaproteobacteria bacterium]
MEDPKTPAGPAGATLHEGPRPRKAARAERKLFAGARLRRLRRDLGLSQARMAEELAISPSYLNLIEANQRPLSARLLLQLAETYDISVKSLGDDDEAHAAATLGEVFSDPLFRNAGLSRRDIEEVAAASPLASDAVGMLYRAFREATENTAALAERLADREGDIAPRGFPVEEVRDFIHARRNHFPAVDDAAEDLSQRLELEKEEPAIALRGYLKAQHGIGVRVVPAEVMAMTLRRYDRHSRRIFLSELLDTSARTFQLAYQIALFEAGPLLDAVVEESGLEGEETRRLLRVQLANYFAAALLMPYGRFLKTAEGLRYDLVLLGRRFGTSFEQVAHRLTTLQRAGAKGVPFFLIRVDDAGNISKRFSAGGFHFATYGGACPRWNIHDAFRVPGRILTQVVQMPDGTTYFSVARTVTRPGSPYGTPDQQLVVGLGCEIGYAKRLVYSDGMDLSDIDRIAMPIGMTCRLCERADCGQRAHPPLARRMVVDETTRGLSPFAFRAE